MPQTPAQSFYLGPFSVYTSDTGMTDPITGQPYLGGSLHEGDYADLTRSEVEQWNIRFGSKLNTGRYRFVRVSSQATAANLYYGAPVGWARPSTLGQVALAAAGSGYTITATGASTGTVTISSSTSGGTAATALLTLSAGVITGAQLVFPGANFTAVPTFTLSSVLSSGSGGSLLAQMAVTPNVISSFDASCQNLASPRGVALCAVSAAQVTANAWIVIQELGIAPVFVTTATQTASGSGLTAATGAAVTSATASTPAVLGFMGYTLDVTAANTVTRCDLALPVRQG